MERSKYSSSDFVLLSKFSEKKNVKNVKNVKLLELGLANVFSKIVSDENKCPRDDEEGIKVK